MRYLNKIVFINSATVKYAEIELDGNVHFIGTQGVGKSTLLRAILFFYNANKIKLGIPREKKSFDEYYFQYQNSYIIYEIVKDNIHFCVLAYKVNGKVAYRFFNSTYKRELFLDENNRAFESWDKIRNAFGRSIHYTSIISSYEDFRRIIYGDNKGLKPEFRKYALIESRQYQNIPRTIQNVFLNSNLEAKFIKDTIINSLNEDEFAIDLENYSKNHLRDFESEINDIKIWFEPNKKGIIVVRHQADKIIDSYRVYNFLKRETKELAHTLATRMNFIEKENPVLTSRYVEENNRLNQLYNEKENLKNLHLKREQKIISDINYLNQELTKARTKQAEYETLNIEQIIQEVAKKETLTTERKSLIEEKNLLTSQFSQIRERYDALILQAQNQRSEFYNSRIAEINSLEREFGENKSSVFETYQQLIEQIKTDHKEEQEKAENVLEVVKSQENETKIKQAELRHQEFFTAEIKKNKEKRNQLEKSSTDAKSAILDAKSQSENIRKEWELEVKKVEQEFVSKIDKNEAEQQKHREQINAIELKIKQSESSLYGWLNTNVPSWENTIGKVIDEDNVLFNTELNPKLVEDVPAAFFGVEINLNALRNRIKTVEEYNEEIEGLNDSIGEIQKTISQLNADKENDLQKLQKKFRKKLNDLKERIAENEYLLSQNEEKLKKNSVELTDWISKAKSEKDNMAQKLERALEEITSKRLKASENIDTLIRGIRRKISLKETARNKEIGELEKVKQEQIGEINKSLEENKSESDRKIHELKTKQTSELKDKGADTERLNTIDNKMAEIDEALRYIEQNEVTVIEYNKDKRELFDKVPQFKAEKTSLEKKQSSIKTEHQIELQKTNDKCKDQKDIVDNIKSKIDEFEKDMQKFDEFEKSEVFSSIQEFLEYPDKKEDSDNSKAALSIISEINDKYYAGLRTFNELRQATNVFIGNFNEQNIFRFKVKLNEDDDFINFAIDLKEFIDEDKIKEYETRVNERFASIIQQIGNETTELISKEAEIEKIIKKINDDFIHKNFVEAIKEMEMRTQKSSNPIVRLLIQIKEFNEEHSLILGKSNLFTSPESNSKNQKAVNLLKQLVKELERSKSTTLNLSESFDLQFRIVENDNDSGWVEKLSNVGSEGTDVLVKAMINILLLNVFKDSASKKIKDFKLHCMMDEIGRLHPNNVKGILRFANERNILLINGSPTSQNAIDYKYTYNLAKEQSKTDPKKYLTKINRLVKVKSKVLS